MRFKTKLLAVALITASTTASAGFFDFFTGESESEKQAKEQKITEAELAKREPDFNIARVDQLAYHTKRRNIEDLKQHQQQITEVLATFETLESNLIGFEERKVVTSLKKFFRDKYVVNQTDLIDIKTNLNEVLKP